jgi:hypothetical protein
MSGVRRTWDAQLVLVRFSTPNYVSNIVSTDKPAWKKLDSHFVVGMHISV